MKTKLALIFLMALCATGNSALVVKPVNVTGNTGDTVEFQCASDLLRTNGEPLPVYWEFNSDTKKRVQLYEAGYLVEWYEGKLAVNETVRGHYPLTVYNIVIEDAGSYKCVDESGFGEEAIAVLTVVAEPRKYWPTTVNTTGMNLTAADGQTLNRPNILVIILSLSGASLFVVLLIGLGLHCKRKHGNTGDPDSFVPLHPSAPPGQVSQHLSTPRLVHTSPGGVYVRGVTCLGNEVFIARYKTSELEVYDVETFTLQPNTLHSTFTLQRRLPVPRLEDPHDMASSEHNNSIYIADWSGQSVFRVEPKGNITQWIVEGNPYSLSVGTNNNIIVTFYLFRSELGEFTLDGELVRTISLAQDIEHPLHTVQLPSGQLLVSDGGSQHRVCLIDDAGSVTQSYGGHPGSAARQLDAPWHLCVDKEGNILVADRDNKRVVLLSPSLTDAGTLCYVYVRDLIPADFIPADRGLQKPWRMCFDQTRRLLFVGENIHGGARVLVFKI